MNRKYLYLSITYAVLLIIGVIGLTYAFFNYTRIGAVNTIRTGNINFSFGQSNTINLTNVFPTDSNNLDNTNSSEVLLTISGDTEYNGGIEYLLTIEDANIIVGTGNDEKNVPVSINVTPEKTGDLGTEISGKRTQDYWQSRGGNTSYYTLLNDDYVFDNERVLAGYIAPGAVGINATIGIKAYFDKDSIAISDTYQGCRWQFTGGSFQCIYQDDYGTLDEWVDERMVLTTNEWNSLADNPISFKIKVEANEGTWVDSRIIEANTISVSNIITENTAYGTKNTTADLTIMEPNGKYKYELTGMDEVDLDTGDSRTVFYNVKEYKFNPVTNTYDDITSNLEVNTIIFHLTNSCLSEPVNQTVVGEPNKLIEFFEMFETGNLYCLMGMSN